MDDDGSDDDEDDTSAPLVPPATGAGATTTATGPLAAALAAQGAASAGSTGPTLPFISYSDPGPAVPFNLGQFLDIQWQNSITRVVDNLLRLSGDAAAQPVRALPGPLVDQPELRAPGQRWALGDLPQLPPLGSAEQRAAADAAGERYRAAADRAQAAAARTAARLGLPPENAPPALPGSTGAVNPFRNVTTARRYNSSKAWRGNFRRGATNVSSSGGGGGFGNNSSTTTLYEEGLGAPLADAAAAASDVIDDAAPAGIATVPAVRKREKMNIFFPPNSGVEKPFSFSTLFLLILFFLKSNTSQTQKRRAPASP